MFSFHFPPLEATLSIQEEERGFYWTRCAPGWLRKHGLAAHFPAAGGNDLHIIGRRVRLAPAALTGPALLEGPLDADALRALGLEAHSHTADKVALIAGALPPACPAPRLFYSVSSGATHLPRTELCAWLQYPRFTVRNIPEEQGVVSDPMPFAPEDARHNREVFAFQSFDPLRLPAPWRPLLFLAEFEGEDVVHRGRAVAVTDGRRLVLGLPLLDLFGVMAQMPPMPVAYMRPAHGLDAEWLQEWLVAALIALAIRDGGSIVRTRRWPAGHDWAMSMRIDYDRLLSDRALADYLAIPKRHGVPITWGFLASRCIERQAAMIASGGHELALHAEAGSLEAFRAELACIEREAGTRPVGTTAHGGLGSFGHSGDIVFEWCERSGLVYGEMIAHSSLTAHRINRVKGGVPQVSELMAPATHKSMDIGMTSEEHTLDISRIITYPDNRDYGGHLILMNHPDIHAAQVAELLGAIDYSACWRTTVKDAVLWADCLHYRSKVPADRHHQAKLTLPVPLPLDALIDVIGGGGTRSLTLPAGACEVAL